MRLFDSLQSRLFVAILTMALPVIVGLSYYVWVQYEEQIEHSELAAENIVRVTAAYDKILLNEVRANLGMLSQAPILREQRWDLCKRYFAVLLTQMPRYVNLGVIDRNGRLVCSGLPDPNPEGSYLGDRAYYQAALRQAEVVPGEFVQGRISNTPTMVMSVRIADDAGQPQSVVYASLNLSYLRAGEAISNMLTQGRLWVLDRRGRVLQRIPGGVQYVGTQDEPHPAGVPGLVRTAVTDARGRVWRRLSVLSGPVLDPWGLSVRYEVPLKELHAEATSTLRIGVTAVVLLMILAALAAWSLTQVAAGRSLKHLRDAVGRLAARDFSERVADRLRGGELREIGRQFDAMADTVQAYQRSLRESEQSYRQLFEGSPVANLVVRREDGRILEVNAQASRQYGYDRQDFLALTLADLGGTLPPEAHESGFTHQQHRRRDGQTMAVEVHGLPLVFGAQQAWLLGIIDQTEQEALSRGLHERERLIEQLMQMTVEAIYGLDAEGNCIFANQACASLLGYEDPAELVGRNFHRLIHYQHEDGRPYAEEDCRMHQALHEKRPVHLEGEVFWRRDGSCFPVECWAYPIWRGSEMEFCMVTFLDITQRLESQQALAYQATHDQLTGLLNRNELMRRLQERMQQAPGVPWVLVMSNVDNFKEVNGALGHDGGDALLHDAARRFQELLGPECSLARVGGDDFAFVLDEPTLLAAGARVQELLAAIREPFVLNDLEVRINCSFGLVHYPSQAHDRVDLVRFVDLAMRRAKREGAGLAYFDLQDRVEARDRLLLRGELRAALDQDHFRLFLQPKVRLSGADGALTPIGFEALARWEHPQRGLIRPAQFIPVIEVSDLVHPFTRWVLEQAVASCARLQRTAPGLGVAVNVSARNLLDARLPGQIDEILRRHALDPALLELEVTESALMTESERVQASLRELQARGIRLTMDDFGTGYSSFAYLKNKLPISTLKIDQSFVAGMEQDVKQQLVVRAMIEMSHALGLVVVAEGIETQGILDLLRDMGCDAGQGYLLGRPMPVDTVEGWLRRF